MYTNKFWLWHLDHKVLEYETSSIRAAPLNCTKKKTLWICSVQFHSCVRVPYSLMCLIFMLMSHFHINVPFSYSWPIFVIVPQLNLEMTKIYFHWPNLVSSTVMQSSTLTAFYYWLNQHINLIPFFVKKLSNDTTRRGIWWNVLVYTNLF